MGAFSNITTLTKSSALFWAWVIASFILLFVWFGSTLNIPDKYDEDTKIRDAKAAAQGFGITFMIPIAVLLLYLFIKQLD